MTRDDSKSAVVREPISDGREIDFALIEAFFFAYRDFTSDPDAILEAFGFGRAHHRVLHFVNRQPGLTVAELLDILKITKQSLARVLKELIDSGFIELYPSEKGRDLALRLALPQSRRIGKALEFSGVGARDHVDRFLKAMAG